MIHLVSAANDSYAPGLCVTLASSLFFLSPKESVTFHILNGGLSVATISELQTLCQRFHPQSQLILHDISPEDFRDWQPGPNNSMMAYARLLLGSLLSASKVIYLDADMLILSDLSELWLTPMQGKMILAARGGEHAVLSEDCPWALSAEEKNFPYINSGLMVIDLDQWRSCFTEKKVKDLVDQTSTKLACYDQTILNYVLRYDIGLISMHWNWQGRILPEKEASSIKIIHFITTKKPWFWWSGDPRFELWRLFYNTHIGSCFQLFLKQKAGRGLFYGTFESMMRQCDFLRWCYVTFLSLCLSIRKKDPRVASLKITYAYYTTGLGGTKGKKEFQNCRFVLSLLRRRICASSIKAC